MLHIYNSAIKNTFNKIGMNQLADINMQALEKVEKYLLQAHNIVAKRNAEV